MKAKSLSERLLISRQIAAVATAFMIPVSTSGQAIAVSIFVLLVALTVKREEWLVTLATPAAAVPVGLFLLLLIGMSWSPTPFASGGGISHYVKLLLIPIAMAPVSTAREALQIRLWVFGGMPSRPSPFLFVFFHTFAASVSPSDGRCADERQCRSKRLFCPMCLRAGLGRRQRVGWGNRRRAVAMIVLALVFLADIFMIFISKTGRPDYGTDCAICRTC